MIDLLGATENHGYNVSCLQHPIETNQPRPFSRPKQFGDDVDLLCLAQVNIVSMGKDNMRGVSTELVLLGHGRDSRRVSMAGISGVVKRVLISLSSIEDHGNVSVNSP